MRKIVSKGFGLLFKYLFFIFANLRKISNINKPSLLFFTDSRGFRIGSTVSYKNGFQNPLVKYLLKHYRVSFDINSFSHTTYLDLIGNYDQKILHQYDHILLILGVVDFSPRKIKDAIEIRKRKLSTYKFDKNFHKGTYIDDGVLYKGSPTETIINENIKDFIIEKLQPYKQKIITVTTVNVDDNWDGSYWQKRPENINRWLEDERIFAKKIAGISIDLSDLEPTIETVDNIHFSNRGFCTIRDRIERSTT